MKQTTLSSTNRRPDDSRDADGYDSLAIYVMISVLLAVVSAVGVVYIASLVPEADRSDGLRALVAFVCVVPLMGVVFLALIYDIQRGKDRLDEFCRQSRKKMFRR